jgi:hypothetical protein
VNRFTYKYNGKNASDVCIYKISVVNMIFIMLYMRLFNDVAQELSIKKSEFNWSCLAQRLYAKLSVLVISQRIAKNRKESQRIAKCSKEWQRVAKNRKV